MINRSEYRKQQKLLENNFKQALTHLRDDPWFKIYQEKLREQREAFIRIACSHNTSHDDMLKSLGAVALIDTAQLLTENATPSQADEQ